MVRNWDLLSDDDYNDHDHDYDDDNDDNDDDDDDDDDMFTKTYFCRIIIVEAPLEW